MNQIAFGFTTVLWAKGGANLMTVFTFSIRTKGEKHHINPLNNAGTSRIFLSFWTLTRSLLKGLRKFWLFSRDSQRTHLSSELSQLPNVMTRCCRKQLTKNGNELLNEKRVWSHSFQRTPRKIKSSIWLQWALRNLSAPFKIVLTHWQKYRRALKPLPIWWVRRTWTTIAAKLWHSISLDMTERKYQ
jgi:hypothetical protein